MQLLAPSKSSSQAMFRQFHRLAPQWTEHQRLLHIPPGRVNIRWVPGHSKVLGNEAADKEAKKGASQQQIQDEPYTYAGLQRWGRQQLPEAMQKLWHTVAPPLYRDLSIQTSPANSKELLLPRVSLGRILAAHSGYRDFTDYYKHFNHTDIYLHC